MNKKFVALTAVTLVSVGLIITAFLIPLTFHYEKQVDIIAQQRMVFVFIGELQRWKEWTKWAARDPEMKNLYSDPSWGEGATYSWKSFWNGSGSAKVTQFNRDNQLNYNVTMDGYDPSYWQFKLTPAQRQGTTVTWIADGKYPEGRFSRLIAYFKMWTLESDIHKGLDRLKKHAELHEAYDVRGDWEPAPAPPASVAPAPPPAKKAKAKK